MARDHRTGRAWAFGVRPWIGVLTMAAVGAATAFGILAGFGHPRWWALPLLAVTIAGSELSMVNFTIGRRSWTLSCTDALTTAVFVLAPGSWMVLMVPAGVAVAQLL